VNRNGLGDVDVRCRAPTMARTASSSALARASRSPSVLRFLIAMSADGVGRELAREPSR
jgi:hypothetical protein